MLPDIELERAPMPDCRVKLLWLKFNTRTTPTLAIGIEAFTASGSNSDSIGDKILRFGQV